MKFLDIFEERPACMTTSECLKHMIQKSDISQNDAKDKNVINYFQNKAGLFVKLYKKTGKKYHDFLKLKQLQEEVSVPIITKDSNAAYKPFDALGQRQKDRRLKVSIYRVSQKNATLLIFNISKMVRPNTLSI